MAAYSQYPNPYVQAPPAAAPATSSVSYTSWQQPDAGTAAVSSSYDSYSQYGQQAATTSQPQTYGQDYSQAYAQSYGTQGQDYQATYDYGNYNAQQWYGANNGQQTTYQATASESQGYGDYGQGQQQTYTDQTYQGYGAGTQSYDYTTQSYTQSISSIPPLQDQSAPGSYQSAAGNYQSSTGNYQSSTGNYQSASGSYPSAAGSYPSAAGSYPSAAGSYPSAAGSYPSAPGGYQSAQESYPSTTGSYPSTTGSYPSTTGSYPSTTGSYQSAPGSYQSPTSAPGSYPSGTETGGGQSSFSGGFGTSGGRGDGVGRGRGDSGVKASGFGRGGRGGFGRGQYSHDSSTAGSAFGGKDSIDSDSTAGGGTFGGRGRGSFGRGSSFGGEGGGDDGRVGGNRGRGQSFGGRGRGGGDGDKSVGRGGAWSSFGGGGSEFGGKGRGGSEFGGGERGGSDFGGGGSEFGGRGRGGSEFGGRGRGGSEFGGRGRGGSEFGGRGRGGSEFGGRGRGGSEFGGRGGNEFGGRGRGGRGRGGSEFGGRGGSEFGGRGGFGSSFGERGVDSNFEEEADFLKTENSESGFVEMGGGLSFASGRGRGSNFGGKGGSDYGGRGSSSNGRGGDRGRGFGGRGGDRGRGFGGRGGDRGRGFGERGDRGRGFGGGDRGSGFGGGDGGSGFGGGDEGNGFDGGDRRGGFGGRGGDRRGGFGGRGGERGSGFGGRGGGRGSGFGGRGGERGSGFGGRGGESGSGFGERGGGRGSGFGGRGAERGSGFGERGGDRGRGFGGRGGDREGGFGGRGGERGSSFGGRGGDRGRGFGGRGGDRGRGFGGRGGDRERGFGGRGRGGNSGSGKTLPTISDLMKKANSQMETSTLPPVMPSDSLKEMIGRWKAFHTSFTDCGSAITTLECSLTASKVHYLQLHFEAKLLTFCQTTAVFTGSIYLNKMDPGMQQVEEGIFFCRGLGNTKKSAKLDCYEKAHELLLQSSLSDILNLQDCDDEALTKEVRTMFRQDPQGFKEMMKRSGEGSLPALSATAKRPSADRKGGPPAKRVRAQPLDRSPHSLVPKKHVDILLKHSDPLPMKIAKLKELLKEEGVTKLHIVPKVDQLGNKAAIIIDNVFRFASMPYPGEEHLTPVFCELYLDKTFMAAGDSDLNHNAAMRQAYVEFTRRVCSESPEDLVDNAKRGFLWNEPNICDVVQKKHLEDNDSLLTSNLANLKQMMQCNPDLSLSLDQFVLMEFEADLPANNSYKMLELSATRNCMILECEMVRNPDMRFTCLISMQGKILCSRISTTKNWAKRACSDNILKELKAKCDIIHVAKQMDGIIHYRSDLISAAKKYRTDGIPPLKCSLKKKEHKVVTTPEDVERVNVENQKAEETERLPENLADKPLLPWMGRVLADLLLDYHTKVTLEDFRIHINDMPKSMRDTVQVVAMKMGLKMVSKFKETTDHAVLRRPIAALEMTKMLTLNDGKSGRLSMKQTKHEWPEDELKTYKEEYVTKYKKLYEDLLQEEEDCKSEPMT